MVAFHVLGKVIELVNWAALVFVVIPIGIANIRMLRTNWQMRVLIWAYEKDLRERGVTLPARCPQCVTILPEHVNDCPLRETYEQLDALTRLLTRPRIKYYPGGERPPHIRR